MIEDSMLELIHREIDGENSAAESDLVRRRLATDPESRRLYEELRALSLACDRMPMSDAPAGLAEAVLRVVRLKPHGRAPSQPWQSRRPAAWGLAKYGYALAAGIILGAFLASPLVDRIRGVGSSETDELLGTMVPGGRAVDPKWDEIRSFGEAAQRGAVRLLRSGGLALVELQLPPGPPAQAVLSWEPGRVELRGFEQPDGPTAPGRVSDGSVEWECRGGARCRFIFWDRESGGSSIRLGISRSDVQLYSGTISLAAAK